ncbi:MAG: DUF2325 domain-containing protein [Betaproteobacteria bacterium]|nr:DUF2325 domain-containing protein [Betaproteobacteria bacterium]
MCLARKATAVWPLESAAQGQRPLVFEVPPLDGVSKSGKRRRALWELSASAACPVLGVCLPMCEQRTLMRKCGIDVQGRSDYELHQIGVSECRRRTPLAERLQKWLDAHFALELRQVADFASADDLRQCWQQAKGEPAWGGLMWALLTHPACLLPLEHEILGDVHMMQHQVGMVTRVEQQQWQQQRSQSEQLRAELAEQKARVQRLLQEGQLRQQQAQAEIQRLRQSLLQAEAEQERLTQRCQQLLAERPDAGALQALRLENADLRQQCQQANRALRAGARPCGVAAPPGLAQPCLTPAVATSSSAAASRLSASAISEASAEPEARSELALGGVGAAPTADPVRPALSTKIACVGGRTAQLPAFREVVEAHGAQLLHHDGGDEHHLSQLSATLAAADWVICQVGCISHNAYWRVKEHCKRTGKPCLYVESTSRSALERAMQRIHTAQHALVCPAKRLDV